MSIQYEYPDVQACIVIILMNIILPHIATQVASVVRCDPPRTSRTPAALLTSVNFTRNLLCQWCPHVYIPMNLEPIIILLLSGTDQITGFLLLVLSDHVT